MSSMTQMSLSTQQMDLEASPLENSEGDVDSPLESRSSRSSPSQDSGSTLVSKVVKKIKIHALGPLLDVGFRPTTIRLRDPETDVAVLIRSRDIRYQYGRNVIAVSDADVTRPRYSWRPARVCRGVSRMFTSFPVHKRGWWIALGYALGSVLFIIASILPLLALLHPQIRDAHRLKQTAGWLTFVGVLFYEEGATLALFGCFDSDSFESLSWYKWEEGQLKRRTGENAMMAALLHQLRRHRKNHYGDVGVGDLESGMSLKILKQLTEELGHPDSDVDSESDSLYLRNLRWFPTWHDLMANQRYSIGFVASSIMWVGGTIFVLFNGMTGIPELAGLFSTRLKLCLYWGPSILASLCFLLASILFTLEPQDAWYKPNPSSLGWWVGAWSTIGSMGFLLCAVFGTAEHISHWCEVQSLLASLWGSCCFLVSGLLMWYESVNSHVVEQLWTPDEENAHIFMDVLPFPVS